MLGGVDSGLPKAIVLGLHVLLVGFAFDPDQGRRLLHVYAQGGILGV
jgi:hypothetical protein